MHKVYNNIIASFYDSKQQTRMFISAEADRYIPPKILIENNELTQLTHNITTFLSTYSNVENPVTLYNSLILAKKVDVAEIDLVYKVELPVNTEVYHPYFLTSYNISVIHPYVRKAIQYL